MSKSLPKNLKNLLLILSDGDFHSGETLGQKLKITRSAIWKLINQAAKLKIEIDSVKGKGYRFREPIFLLDQMEIKHLLSNSTQSVLKYIQIIDQITSTNDYLKQQHDTPICVMSEQQTQGRGRFNREWLTPFGKNISLSGSWQFKDDITALSGLSIVIGLGVLEGLQPFVKELLKLKWPNDVIADNKKLAGILVDVTAEANGFAKIIYGIGVNINDTPNTVNATSLKTLTKVFQNRNHISASILNVVIGHLKKYEAAGFEPFKKSWEKHDYLAGKMLTLTQGEKTIQGYAHGIDDKGRLLLKDQKGHIIAYSSGDTTFSQKPKD